MKFELKPYVFTRAIASDVSPEQQPVDQRPAFHSMQPIVISHGAKMQQVSLLVFAFPLQSSSGALACHVYQILNINRGDLQNTECLLIFVCFVFLYTIAMYNYGHLCILRFFFKL